MTTGTESPGKERYRVLLTTCLLMAAAWCFYLPSIKFDFIRFDDVRILRDHPELYGPATMTDGLRAIFTTCFPREEPLLLRDVTWLIDSRLFGFGNPVGYHLGNVLLHGVVVGLLFLFLFQTTRRYQFSLAIAVGYLILAIHTEPVVWIMGRKDILSALFMLLALCAQNRRLTAQSTAAMGAWHGATFLFLVGGLLSKINVITFPAVLFLHGVFFRYLRGERSSHEPLSVREVLREFALVIPLLAVSGVIYVWYRNILTQMGIFNFGYAARGWDHFWNLLMINPLAFWMYLRQTFLPGQLTVLYTWPALQTTYPAWQVVVSLATVAGIIAGGFWLYRKQKGLFFYYSAFFVFLVPYTNLLYVGIWVADRYLYFASFCVLAIAATAITAVLQKATRAWRLGVMAGALLCGIANLWQKLDYQASWRTAESLWQYHITLPRPSRTAFENLAAYYYEGFAQDASKNSLALKKMQIVIDAGFNEFWKDRGQSPPHAVWYLSFLQSLIQEVTGDFESAARSLLLSERLNPRFAATKLNLARLYHKMAVSAASAAKKPEYARAAREKFEQYVALQFRTIPAPREVRDELKFLVEQAEASPPGADGAPMKDK
jgi:hypothetical protein